MKPGDRTSVTRALSAHPDWDRRTVVEHALDRVVGIELNDHACALARARGDDRRRACRRDVASPTPPASLSDESRPALPERFAEALRIELGPQERA